jgi:DNA-binding NarL/FixJ family response regulator
MMTPSSPIRPLTKPDFAENDLAEGKSNKLIADALKMSESTVKAHVKQIIRRLNVANRTQAGFACNASDTGALTRLLAL